MEASNLERIYQARVKSNQWYITEDGRIFSAVCRPPRELVRDVLTTTLNGKLLSVSRNTLLARHFYGEDYAQALEPVVVRGKSVKRKVTGKIKAAILRMSSPAPDGEGLTREAVAGKLGLSVGTVQSVCTDAGLASTPPRHLTPEEREKAFAMLDAGESQTKVAGIVGIKQASLSRLYRRHKAKQEDTLD